MYYDRSYNEGYGAASNAAAASVQPLKFGGKEVERHGGLNWHDFKARWLSNGRFTTQDPKRETYYPLSPYAYCADNPVRNIDPTGRKAEISIVGDQIYINVQIYIRGQYATQELAEAYENALDNSWESYKTLISNSGKAYKINWNVSVEVKQKIYKSTVAPPSVNFYDIIPFGRSKTYDTCRGYLRSDIGANGNPIMHEFGHIIGLMDHYEGNSSDAGWEGNVMAESAGKGVVQQQNIDDMLLPITEKYEKSIYHKLQLPIPWLYFINASNMERDRK